MNRTTSQYEYYDYHGNRVHRRPPLPRYAPPAPVPHQIAPATRMSAVRGGPGRGPSIYANDPVTTHSRPPRATHAPVSYHPLPLNIPLPHPRHAPDRGHARQAQASRRPNMESAPAAVLPKPTPGQIPIPNPIAPARYSTGVGPTRVPKVNDLPPLRQSRATQRSRQSRQLDHPPTGGTRSVTHASGQPPVVTSAASSQFFLGGDRTRNEPTFPKNGSGNVFSTAQIATATIVKPAASIRVDPRRLGRVFTTHDRESTATRSGSDFHSSLLAPSSVGGSSPGGQYSSFPQTTSFRTTLNTQAAISRDSLGKNRWSNRWSQYRFSSAGAHGGTNQTQGRPTSTSQSRVPSVSISGMSGMNFPGPESYAFPPASIQPPPSAANNNTLNVNVSLSLLGSSPHPSNPATATSANSNTRPTSWWKPQFNLNRFSINFSKLSPIIKPRPRSLEGSEYDSMRSSGRRDAHVRAPELQPQVQSQLKAESLKRASVGRRRLSKSTSRPATGIWSGTNAMGEAGLGSKNLGIPVETTSKIPGRQHLQEAQLRDLILSIEDVVFRAKNLVMERPEVLQEYLTLVAQLRRVVNAIEEHSDEGFSWGHHRLVSRLSKDVAKLEQWIGHVSIESGSYPELWSRQATARMLTKYAVKFQNLMDKCQLETTMNHVLKNIAIRKEQLEHTRAEWEVHPEKRPVGSKAKREAKQFRTKIKAEIREWRNQLRSIIR